MSRAAFWQHRGWNALRAEQHLQLAAEYAQRALELAATASN